MKMKCPSLPMLSLSLCLGLAAPAVAQQAEATPEVPQASATPEAPPAPAPLAPIPDLRLYLASFSLLRQNPLGLESQLRLILQKRMFDSESRLMRDTFVSGALSLKANPAAFRVGPMVELQPVAIFNVRAGYEYVRFLGSFGFLQSFPNSLADHSDDTRELTKDTAYSTSGHHFLVEPTVQARVKQFVVRSRLVVDYWNMALREGDRGTFYDPMMDTLVPGKGWVLSNDTDVLMRATPQLTVGARFSAVFPKYGDGDEDGTSVADNSHMRVGPMAAYAFNTDEGTMFNKPTLLVVAGWYLKHQSRQAARPYLLAGFGFTSDLMGGK